MRNVFVSLLLVSLLVSVSSAQIFIGAREAGMGGTGVASSTGLSSVAYNPAGFMKGPDREFLLSLGASNQGMDQLLQSFSSASDPAQFMVDNFGKTLNANGNVNGILGVGINHIGVSVVIPTFMAALNKPANTLAGSVTALAMPEAVLTLGHSFSVPGLPASLDVGANVKAITGAYGTLTIAGTPTPTTPVTATQSIATAQGTGFDIGAKTTVDIPFVTDFSVGVAMRDVAQSVKYTPKTRTDTYTVTTPGGDPTITKGAEVTGAETTANAPVSTVIGAAATVPVVGLKVAADITSVSGGTDILATTDTTITSLGLEYPLLANVLVLRGGVMSGNNISFTTLGAKIGIPFLTLEIANVIDNNNSANTAYVVDAGVAF